MLDTKVIIKPQTEIQFGVSRHFERVKRLIRGVNCHKPLLEFGDSRF